MKFGFGYQLWLRDYHIENFYRMLDELALEGLDGFECLESFLLDWFERRPQEFHRLLDMHGLQFSSYYTGGEFTTPEQRDQYKQTVKRRARFMAAAGYENILLDGGHEFRDLNAQQLDDYIRVIADTANELGEYCKTLGLKTHWHQHWGSVFEKKQNFYRFMELLDPALVGFCCDCGQLELGDFDVLQTVRDFADRITFMHYKDVTKAGRPDGELWPGKVVPCDEGAYNVDSRYRWVELGRGCVPYVEITKIMAEHHYDGWIVDDFDYTGYQPRACVRACKEYLNQACGIWTDRDKKEGRAPAGVR